MVPGTYTVTLTNDMGCQTIDTTILTNQATIFIMPYKFKPHLLYRSQWHDKPGYYFQYKKINILWSTGEKYYPTQLSKGRHLLLNLTDAAGCVVIDSVIIVNAAVYPELSFYAVPRQLQTQMARALLIHEVNTGKHNLFMGQCSFDATDTLSPLAGASTSSVCAHRKPVVKKIPPFW